MAKAVQKESVRPILFCETNFKNNNKKERKGKLIISYDEVDFFNKVMKLQPIR